jgi:hypothetical protein
MFGAIGVVLGWVTWRHVARRRAFVQNSGLSAGVVIGLREERDGLEAQQFRYPKVQFRTSSGREVVLNPAWPTAARHGVSETW